MILDRFLNAFGGHVGLIFLLISISFYTRFQIMRSRCQDECEADVKIMRSRCQGECEADVKMNVFYCFFPFCELGGDLFHDLRSSQVRGTEAHPIRKISDHALATIPSPRERREG